MKISRGGYTAPGGSTKLTQDYHFVYDIFGRPSGAAIGTDVKLAEYMYDHVTGNLLYMGYGNAGALVDISYSYDDLGSLQGKATGTSP